MVGYLLLLAILWWGVSWKLGAKLFAVLVLSVYLNALIKELRRRAAAFRSTPISKA